MHQHIEWDAPGAQSVAAYYAQHPEGYSEPRPGVIVSGRYEGANVRVKVEAYKDGVSIGSVAAIIDAQGKRLSQHGKLRLGDMVRLPDDQRAFEAVSESPRDDEG
ncbi:hypothetical protein [Halomonas piscis]|uniref:hypothetical protein n=1 Tax=Halomonas piscis TaxID=3031727 RepID=UPI002896A419|nr:hypothetical protein [Halomonas piscis]